jgi:hypothetical protein
VETAFVAIETTAGELSAADRPAADEGRVANPHDAGAHDVR